ncbi:MAG: hypothetical protein LUE16_01145 [Lachnospiraceae bacterium]|nr:hypothetical protein [Lachnospiraceae bacterium]
MKLHLMENRNVGGYTTFGSVWERGEVPPESGFSLTDGNGDRIPVQSRVTAYWPDGSVKWAAHTADSERMGHQVTVEAVKPGSGDEDETADGSEQIRTETADSCALTQTEDSFCLRCQRISVTIPKSGTALMRDLYIDGQKRVQKAELTLILERRNGWARTEIPGIGVISRVTVEDGGPLLWCFKLEGSHVLMPEESLASASFQTGEGSDAGSTSDTDGEQIIPFVVRLYFGIDSGQVHITHTFLYDGDVNRDFLKGLGIRFYTGLQGESYNRHVRFGTDHGSFHEASVLLSSWHPRIPQEIYQDQIGGKAVAQSQEELDRCMEERLFSIDGNENKPGSETERPLLENIQAAASDMPSWSRYQLCQDSDSHFLIRKKISDENCCFIDSLHGNRAKGTVAAGGTNGGLLIGKRDFWQKYPSGLEVQGLDQDQTLLTCWIYTPAAEAYDFRHYTTTGYSQTYYEGFPVMGADPVGIANTNTLVVEGFDGIIPTDNEMEDFARRVQKPAVYVGEPEYYHEKRAFGYWSLPSEETPVERWLEEQLDGAVKFYEKEIETRRWYGLFNYGDIIHTYDSARHCWKYDMGGYAWQNTELVPTLWLWLMFLRTGREDVFSLAEAMCRHCSEVDIYHFGKYKGLGSRHNVRHWGCSCKEARIAMAGHHRYYYYLTGERRLEDIFDEVKDAEQALYETDPLRFFSNKEEMTSPTHARSGPDWSSLVSDWMTQWERTGDKTYEKKIRTGVEDIKSAPLKLVSGPDFEFDPATAHLRYIGDRATGGTHLQICMGAAQVWTELTLLIDDEQWNEMLAQYGRFYYLDREKQVEESGGIIGSRQFTLPFMASGIAAYAAAYLQDEELTRKTWQYLFHSMVHEGEQGGFAAIDTPNAGNQKVLEEIPWISTNFVSQWCLNTIFALDFIREKLPQKMDGVRELLEEFPENGLFHKA